MVKNLTDDGIVTAAPPPAEPAERLRARGVQVTAQRLAVVRAVSECPHSTANEVAAYAKADIGAISRQAVYDALSVLVEAGILRRIQPAGSSARYEHQVGDNHHHLVCRECGRMVDVECSGGPAAFLTPAREQGYEVDEVEVIYRGRCAACRN